MLLQDDVGENVGERDDAGDAHVLVDNDQAMHFTLDDALHDSAERLVARAAGHAVEAVAAVLERLHDRDLQIGVALLGGQIDHVELGVNVDQLVVRVDDGQRGHARTHEYVERLGDGRAGAYGAHGAERADAEVGDRLLQKLRLRHVVDEQVEVA